MIENAVTPEDIAKSRKAAKKAEKERNWGAPILCIRCKKSGGMLLKRGNDYIHKDCSI